MRSPIQIILGSASERRKRILETLGLSVHSITADADEIHRNDDPVGTVLHNACTKHDACRTIAPPLPLVTADTVVFAEGKTLGKPANFDEAVQFLKSYSGHVQTVFTGVALSFPGSEMVTRCAASRVLFKEIDSRLAEQYLQKAKTLDRAGAYDIDTYGKMLIASFTGSFTNIMGLPRGIVRDWLEANGVSTRHATNERREIPREHET